MNKFEETVLEHWDKKESDDGEVIYRNTCCGCNDTSGIEALRELFRKETQSFTPIVDYRISKEFVVVSFKDCQYQVFPDGVTRQIN